MRRRPRKVKGILPREEDTDFNRLRWPLYVLVGVLAVMLVVKTGLLIYLRKR